MNEFSPEICPPYKSVQTIHYHHDQYWAGTPDDFLDSLFDDFEYREDDVWVISYPRSGTSWTYALVCAVLYKGDIDALREAQNANKILKFLPVEVGSAASVTERIKSWNELPSPRVIPTHLPYRLFPKRVLDHGGKVVYVRRDPRDVAVSFYHFHRSHQLLGFYKGSWDDFFECFISGQLIYGSWYEHTSGWLPHAKEYAGNVLMLHYEDMRQDLVAQIRRINAFLAIMPSPNEVAAIAEHCSFQSMSTNPFTNREGNPTIDSSISPFLRKGVVGDWKNYFTQTQGRRLEEWERSLSSVRGD